MKRLLLIVLPLLLIVGCSKPINEETLIDKDGLKYHPETKELYSGKVFQNWMGGEKKFEGSYKDGKEDGLWTYWDKNDSKEYKGTLLKETDYPRESDIKTLGNGSYLLWMKGGYIGKYFNLKDGKQDGLFTGWYENGQNEYEGTFKDGKQDGLFTGWYENGKMKIEETYKDVELISKKEWNEDGSVNIYNIYDSEEYKNLTKKEIIVGESVWVTTCFRCHMYGNMGAASVRDKVHFEQLATKGFDQLYESVLNGMDGEEGVMPAKGTCFSCSEDDLKKSVYYIFHLAKRIQDAELAEKEIKIE